MRIEAIFFVLLSLSFSQCIGAPPQKVGTSSSNRGKAVYTTQEDEFIVEALTRLPGYIPLFGSAVWEEITEKHNEKWQQGTYGFPQERSIESLRCRFKHILQYNRPDTIKLPETLLQKLEAQRNPNRAKRCRGYNPEERRLIIEELLKPSCKTLHGAKTWETIRAEHDRRRLIEKLPEFKNERTTRSLRSQMCVMMQRGQLPDEVLKKFALRQKGPSASNPPNQQTNLQETLEDQDEDELNDEMIERLLNSTDDGVKSLCGYTVQEDKLIIDELTRIPDDYITIFSTALWDKIADKHHEKWQQGTLGFPQERSRDSLRSRFKNILIYNHKGHVKLPKYFLQKLEARRNLNIKGSAPYSEEESNLIFQELLKPSCRSIYQLSTWEAIHAEHDRRRLVDKHPAFQHERTVEGLRQYIVRRKGQLPDEIAKKFKLQQKGANSGMTTTPNQQTDLQIAEMIEELLNNTDYEIDFSMLEPEDK